MEMEKRNEMDMERRWRGRCCAYEREGPEAFDRLRQSEWLGFFSPLTPGLPLSSQVSQATIRGPNCFWPKTCIQATNKLAPKKKRLTRRVDPEPDPPEPEIFRIFWVRIISDFGSKFCVHNPKLSGGFRSG